MNEGENAGDISPNYYVKMSKKNVLGKYKRDAQL